MFYRPKNITYLALLPALGYSELAIRFDSNRPHKIVADTGGSTLVVFNYIPSLACHVHVVHAWYLNSQTSAHVQFSHLSVSHASNFSIGLKRSLPPGEGDTEGSSERGTEVGRVRPLTVVCADSNTHSFRSVMATLSSPTPTTCRSCSAGKILAVSLFRGLC